MMRLAIGLAALASVLYGQPDIVTTINGRGVTALAVPDFRGDQATQPFMSAFNDTLWRDLDDSAFFKMVPKGFYPAAIPQQPSELLARDWAMPPAQAAYLAMGYAAAQNGTLRVIGWLMDVHGGDTAAQVFEKSYGESVDTAGARQAAHKFAADILAGFGASSLLGTHIYYVHESRPAPDRLTEIWTMDFDGANQHRIAGANASFTQPGVSPDGAEVAFVSAYPRHELLRYSTDKARALPFQNQNEITAIASPSYTPDGKQIVFAQSIQSKGMQIFIANKDGGNQHTITGTSTTDAEPKVNPKTGGQIAFSSGRSGREQLYLMNSDGTGVERLSDGIGEASNPSWHPNGQILTFASTSGYAAGAWNIFVMDVARHTYVQLTHNEGKNENPVWAPDGRHIVFSSTRSGRPQIWSMAADGTQLRQLTTEGSNSSPVWGK
jgi:TolB protein